MAYKEIFKVQSTQANNPNGLTSAQKETDFRYLTNLAVKVWPFVGSNVKTKGLSDISALTEDYIQKAGKTKNDTEFMNLIEEYITHLSQTGHANLLYEDPYALALAKSDKNMIKPMLSFYNIDENALNKVNYWFEIDDKIVKTKYMEPEVKINYINGKYVVTEATKLRSSGTVLPKGSEIENIDGYPVDEYVKMLQKIDEIKNLPGYDDSWITFKVTHKISPEDRLPFDGKVYLLVDGNDFSASEDFAQSQILKWKLNLPLLTTIKNH